MKSYYNSLVAIERYKVGMCKKNTDPSKAKQHKDKLIKSYIKCVAHEKLKHKEKGGSQSNDLSKVNNQTSCKHRTYRKLSN